MAALTADRLATTERPGSLYAHPVAAGVTIYKGALVVLDGAGNAAPATTATGLTGAGRAEEHVDNVSGAAGDETVGVKRGTFHFANDGTDVIDRTHIGGSAYAVDDQTVAATDGTGTRSAVGIIRDVDAGGVWVEI